MSSWNFVLSWVDTLYNRARGQIKSRFKNWLILFIYFFPNQHQVEADQFTGDDTALNAIILRCGDQSGHHFVSEIKSNNGEWGQWQDLVMCNTYINGSNAHDFIVGFQLKVEQDQVGQRTTENSEFFARILFSRIVIKDIFATLKTRSVAALASFNRQ